eukprot:jgi/Mesen1/7056/ME000369S06368
MPPKRKGKAAPKKDVEVQQKEAEVVAETVLDSEPEPEAEVALVVEPPGKKVKSSTKAELSKADQAASQVSEPRRTTRASSAGAPKETVAESLATKEKAAPAPKKAVAAVPALSIGDYVPELGDLETDESTPDAVKSVNIMDVVKESGLVLFFYPKANTGGCTKQAIGFNDNLEKIKVAGYTVFGMSADKPKSQASWKKKYDFKYNLLSDPTYQALKKLGVTKGAKSIARSHIIIAKGGKIEDVRIGISPGNSYTEALKTVKAK